MAASLGNATVNVLARTVLFEQSLRRSLKRMSVLTAAVFAGVGAANFFGKAVQDSMALEKQVARIHTLLSTPVEEGLFSTETVRNLSNEIGMAADKTAESLFYLLSSGIKAADAMDVLAQSSKTAVAQNADLKQVTDFASSALNAYGGQLDRLTKSQIDAEGANDILNRALDKGKGTMNDFAKYISTAIPIADSLGISLSEVASAGATSTLTGMSARKAFTGLKVAMQELNSPTVGLGEAFEEITGKTFREFIAQGGTLEEGFLRLGKAIGAANITTVAGAKEGGAAIQQLLQLWPQYQDTLEAVGNSGGVTAAKFEKVDQSLSRQVERLKIQFANFRGSVGDWLGPVLADSLNKIKEWWPKIKAVVGEIASVFGEAFAQIAAALGPAFDQIKMAFEKIDWAGVFEVIKSAVTGVLLGLAPFIAVMTGIFYIFVAGLQYVAPFVELLNNMKPIIVGITAAFVAYKTVLWATLIISKAYVAIQKLQAIWTAAVTAAQILQIGVTGGLAGAWTALTLVMSANPIGAVIAVVVGLAAALIYAWKKSETFRKVVATAFNAVKDTIVTAVQVIVNIATYWAEAYLRGFKAILDGLAHLPDWLGGGKFADASAAVGRLISGVEAIRNSVNDLADAARAADWEIKKMGQNLLEVQDYAGRTSMDRLSLLRAGVDPDTTTAINAGELNLNNATNPYGGGGGGGGVDFSGGGYNPDKSGAKEAANKLKDALKRVFTDLGRIAKNTSKQSVDTLKQNFKTLWEDLGEAGRKDLIKFTQAEEKRLINNAAKRNKTLKAVLKKYKADTLVEMAVARDKILDKLGTAKDKLKQLTDEAADFKKSIRETVLGLGNVSQASDGIGVTFTGIRNRMRKAVIETQRFNAAIKTLQKLKLNPELIRQLVEAGPEALDQAATIAASGKKGVAELNGLQDQLLKQSQTLEKTAYDQFFKNGIAVAQGLVNGLEKEKAAILKAMDSIADSLVARIKKKLNIKSPSRVFGEIGENITKGLAIGINAQSPAVHKASQSVSQNINFGPGSVAVSGVGDTAAQRAGILTGQGIVQVLRERQIAAQLSGVA